MPGTKQNLSQTYQRVPSFSRYRRQQWYRVYFPRLHKAQAETQLTSAVRGLLAIAEAYPDLKANQNFLALQEELTSTENRIGFSRQHYNEVVTQFNQAILQFPANMIAGVFGFHPADFFNLDPAEAAAVKQVPKVQF